MSDTHPYYSSVSQHDDDLWYFVGRDGETHGPFTTECDAIDTERKQWEDVDKVDRT